MRAQVRLYAMLAVAVLTHPLAPGGLRNAAAAGAPAHEAAIHDSAAVVVALALEPTDRGVLVAAATAPTDAVRRLHRIEAPHSAAAVQYLRAHGFTVTGRSPWLVTAAGTAAQARRAFDVQLLRAGTRSGRAAMRPRRPVDVPRALAGRVSAVIGLDTRPRWRPHAVRTTLSAKDLRAAYRVRAPMSGAAGMTVATAQFSGWDPRDLQTYAAATGVPMPTVTERAVGGADPRRIDGTGGEIEVALDHEALLASAPGADHVIYFGHNSPVGAAQLYDAIATAAEKDEFDVLSISWGFCELETPRSTLLAINDALARVVAAGKTVFAAAGDRGAFDCDSPRHARTASVNFPASSPYVVGVGGTTLTRGATGLWSETGWHDTSPVTPVAGGGGFSLIFNRPTWQPAVTADDPPGANRRMVPDIAAVADPASGFGIFVRSDGGWIAGGGTSLASPVSAGHFASALAAAGKIDGLGRALHPILYANPHSFRDIVRGENFRYAAAPGFDVMSGLGAPLWDTLLPLLTHGPLVSVPAATRSRTVPVSISLPTGRTFSRYRICESNEDAHCAGPDIALDPAAGPLALRLADGPTRRTRIIVVGFDDAGREFPGAGYTTYDVDPPVVSAAARVTAPTTARFSWGAVDVPPGTGVSRYDVRVTQVGVSSPIRSYAGALTSLSVAVQRGATYTVAVRASDRIGNLSTWRRVTLTVPQASLSAGLHRLAGPAGRR